MATIDTNQGQPDSNNQHSQAAEKQQPLAQAGLGAYLRVLWQMPRAALSEFFFKEKPLDQVKAIGELVIFAVAIYGACIVHGQFAQGQQGLELTRQSMHSDKRPWVLSSETPITKPDGEPGPVVFKPDSETKIRFYLKNSGESPALRTRYYGCLDVSPTEPSTDCLIPSESSAGAYGPGVAFWQSFLVPPMNTQLLNAVRNGSFRIWVRVTVEYADQFPPAHTHHSSLCFYYSVSTEGWVTCESGSTAD
jgi:hypothetical protein